MLPIRSQTYPLQGTQTNKKGVKKGEAFDPEELCRRLEKYRREEQEACRRRRARARDKKGDGSVEYRHVPQCAATSFARTATPDLRKEKEIHKLSRQVVQIQPSAVDLKHPLGNNGPTIRQIVEEREMARLKMEATADRNQFQRNPALEEAARADQGRNLNKPQQRDFVVRLSGGLPSNLRSPSGGDISEWDLSKVKRSAPPRHIHGLPNPNDRNDWVQRDDCVQTDRLGLREMIVPFSEVVRRFSVGTDEVVRRFSVGTDEVVRRFSVGKERGGGSVVSPKSQTGFLGDDAVDDSGVKTDDAVDDSGVKTASHRKSSFLSRPLFRKH